METIVAIDASDIGPIMKYLGLDGLIAIAKRGDHFFYSKDFEVELERSGFLKSQNGKVFEAWIEKQRNPPAGYTSEVSIVEIDDVLDDERDVYDPNRKRDTEKGGYETWDMSVRKRMALHPQFDYEIISREKDFYENKNRNIYDRITGKHTKIVDVPFRYTTMKKLMAEMVVHPDLNLTREQYKNIRENWHTAFGDAKGRNQGTLYFPSTYEEALRQRAFRSKARGEIFDLSGQADARLGGAPADPGAGVAMSASGASLDDQVNSRTGGQTGGETGGRIEPQAGLSGKASGSLQESPSIGRQLMNMARRGAPVVITAAAAYAMHDLITREMEESGLPYLEAAQALGIELTREQLKGLAADAGLDLAITLTPIGPLKKVWDVLGNIDDIVSLMQLYGEVYPENETIQQMAAIADEMAGSAALAAYVEGRDALTGAIGGAIDFVLGSAESEEEAAEAIGRVRSAIREGNAELGEAAANGASRDELTDLLLHRAEASDPAPLAEPDLSAPDLSPGFFLEGEAPPSGAGQIPGSDSVLPSTLSPGLSGDESPSGEVEAPAQGAGFNDEVPAGAQFIRKTGVSFSPAARGASEGSSGVDPYARKTSYDRNRKLGRTAEEEAEALAEFEDLLREAYVVTGNMPMAQGMASAQLKVEWGSSAFAAEEGTVMKYPVEKAYVDPEKDGHGYVRSDVERLLASAGIRATRWYLEPNGKTPEDRFRGIMDAGGYGPRMTLSYDDEAGNRHVVTDAFQAHVNAARQRRRAAEEREQREMAELYGIAWPEPPEVDPFEILREGLARQASLPELRKMAREQLGRAGGPMHETAAEDTLEPPPVSLPGEPPAPADDQTIRHQQGGVNRPFSLPERN